MPVNWNALQSPDIGGAFMSGMQMGKQQRQERQQQNALSAYAQNPDDPNVISVLAQSNPRLAIQIREDQQKRQAQMQMDDLAGRAASGDNDALQQLLVKNPDAFKAIDGATKAKMKEQADFMGNAALHIGNLPEEQRAATWAQYVQQAESGGMDIPAYLEAYSPQALNSVLARSGMVKDWIAQSTPKTIAVQPGGTVYEYNPQPSFAGGGQGGSIATAGPSVGAVEDGYRFKGGDPANASSWEPVGQGGQTPPASGNFRPVGIQGERVTSTFRAPARNAAVGGVSNSFHMRKGADGKPMARDSVPPPGVSMAAYAAELKRLNPNYDVINEGDHVHIEPRG